jgi:hypothetical protein
MSIIEEPVKIRAGVFSVQTSGDQEESQSWSHGRTLAERTRLAGPRPRERVKQLTPLRAVERVDRIAELTDLVSDLVESSSDGFGTRDVAKPSSALRSGSRAPHITTRSIPNAKREIHGLER